MTLVLLTPLAVEAATMRGAVPGARVERTGMGEARARRAAIELRERDEDTILVTGLCGAVDRSLHAGDVVVATELLGPDGSRRPLPAGGPLEAALKRRGLQVRSGTLATVSKVTGPTERAHLRDQGAVAVDMESAWLADGAGDRPFAVVRVVADEADRRLLHPATVPAGVRALRSLRRTAPALSDWAGAVGSRKIVLAAPRSFCAGVDRAIEIVERALELKGPPVYVRKQIVHNVHVVGQLERMGAVFVDELFEVPEGATVVFSAHGVSPEVRAEAAERKLDVIDATCPLVTKVHAEARRFAKAGNTIFLVGHAGHEEVEGTFGEAPDAIRIVERPEDVAELEVEDPERVTYLMQTTLAVDDALEVVDAIRSRFPLLRGPRSDDICYATHNRQNALKEIAREADLVLVVGSETSSNSKRLVEVAEREGTPAYLLDDESELDPAWLTGVSVVGLTAGASAPDELVQRLIAAIGGFGPVEVEERLYTEESMHFRLPKEVR
jgi:4-hydroxy-3-methylbut-2-enyl diphosphate reductase